MISAETAFSFTFLGKQTMKSLWPRQLLQNEDDVKEISHDAISSEHFRSIFWVCVCVYRGNWGISWQGLNPIDSRCGSRVCVCVCVSTQWVCLTPRWCGQQNLNILWNNRSWTFSLSEPTRPGVMPRTGRDALTPHHRGETEDSDGIKFMVWAFCHLVRGEEKKKKHPGVLSWDDADSRFTEQRKKGQRLMKN